MDHSETKAGRILTWRPSAKLLAVGAAAALILLLVPLLRIIPYAAPWYDDYNYGAFAKRGMMELPGIAGALKGAAECVRIQWYAWQGTYSSIFFMALMPAIWGEDKYFLGPLFILILLVVAVFVLVKVLVKNVLKADTASCIILQAVTTAVVVVLIHSSNAGIFWYNAGIHYVGMHAFGMLLAASQIRLLQVRKRSAAVLFVLLGMTGAALVAGSNFVTALQSLLILLTILALAIRFYRKRALLLLPSLCIYAAGFWMNVAAPGNSVRARNYVGWGFSPVMSVLRSFLEAFKHLGEFTGWITLAVLVLLAPVIWKMVQKCSFSFRFPGLVLAWSFCLYAAGFTPSLYSLGHAGLSRALNAVKITYQILLLLNAVYWLGWLNGKLKQKQTQERMTDRPAPWWFYPCVGALMLVIFSCSNNQAGTYSSFGAYYYVHTGEAYNFHQQYSERVEILKGSESNVVLEPYRFKPWLLCTGDLSENPQEESNRAIASWYGKESVSVKREE